MLDNARATGKPLEATWRLALGAGCCYDKDAIKALTALKDERLSCPMQSVTCAGGEMVVKAIQSNAELAAGFTLREMGVYAGAALFAYSYVEGEGDPINAGKDGVDTTIAEFAVEVPDGTVKPASDPNAIITDKEYDAVKVELANTVVTVKGVLGSQIGGVPDIPISVGGSTQASISDTVRANNASGNVLTVKKGMAAGTYGLSALLQRLVRDSHSHETTELPNTGAGNCDCNCEHTDCAPNCTECVNCAQCKTIAGGNCFTHATKTISLPLATTDNVEAMPDGHGRAYALTGVAPGDGVLQVRDTYQGEYHHDGVGINGFLVWGPHWCTPSFDGYIKKGDRYWVGMWRGHEGNCQCDPCRHENITVTFKYIT